MKRFLKIFWESLVKARSQRAAYYAKQHGK